MMIGDIGEEKYGRAKIIPVFLPNQGCPNRCIFCNQKEVVGTSLIHTPREVYPLIQAYLNTIRTSWQKKWPGFSERIEVAFYGGNFTGLPAEVQREFLRPAARLVSEGQIDGLRISTRPDYISEAGLELLASFGVKTVEVGVQSMDEEVLKRAGRLYSGHQVTRAVELLRGGGFIIGLHLMVGLPGESPASRSETIDKVIKLSPHFVRIHPTLVLKGTELERMYREGNYRPMSLDEATEVCKEFSLRLMRSRIGVARIGLQSVPQMQESESVIAGPFHPALGELVASSIAYERMEELLSRQQSGRLEGGNNRQIMILVPERELSMFIGHKRQNLNRLRQKYCGWQIFIQPDRSLKPGELRCVEIVSAPV